MSLRTYRSKRRLSESHEPSGSSKSSSNPLQFVVQKHAARHLHYDFRLELDGVLKSWAIPKGPTLDPTVKRLAIEVEDHPLEYGSFEGTIPKGNYGAGEVIVWDKGDYAPASGEKSRKDQEKSLRAQFKKGEIKFVLNGEKLKGEFALVRIGKDEKKNQWLFIKKKDQYQSTKDLTKDTRSVISENTIENPGDPKASDPIPHRIKPMLAYLIDQPFHDKDWIFEIKWDGYRAIAEVESQKVLLYSRNFLSFNEKFPSIVQALKRLKDDVVLDGEIVIVDKEGKSNFQLLQNYLNSGKGEGELRYCIFDILYYKGHDLRKLPLNKRKEILQEFLKKLDVPVLQLSDFIEERGSDFFELVAKQGLEGIMAKEKTSPYVSKRSRNWLKIKCHQTQEAIIGGFTSPKGSRKHIGALLLGIYRNDKFVYVGHVGGGFDSKMLEHLSQLLKPLIISKCPFSKSPSTNTPATWVKPKLSCEVSFQEWTNDGKMRQPIFKKLFTEEKNAPRKKMKKTKEPQVSEIETNREKIFWPKEGYTKGDLLDYYQAASAFILPYLKNRPITLKRFPNGIHGQSFFQKNVEGPLPEWISTVKIEHTEKAVNYLIVKDLPGLLYTVNLGAIELHPFLSQYPKIDYPDFLVLDLDPVETPFETVIEVAQGVHALFEELKIDHYCKTSGKRGLHIYLPLNAKYEYEDVKKFAELLAHLIHQSLPEITSLERNPSKRKHKVYIDYLQNGQTKTVIAPYAVRAIEGAPVSTPLEWKEIKKGLDPQDFTIKTILKRLKKKGDLFEGIYGKGIDLSACLKRINAL